MHPVYFVIAVALSALTGISACSPVYPRVKGEPTVIGILEDASLNRDSCGSVIFGQRALWVCRDTQPSTSDLPIICSSASWTDLPARGGGTGLNMYGDNQWKSYYPLVEGNCNGNEAGACEDGTRYPHWPDSPPLVTYDNGQKGIGYTWIGNYHITELEPIVRDPSTTLYKVTHDYGSDAGALPHAEILDTAFWAEAEIPFGRYGGLVRNSMAYLYGQGSNWKVALARVPISKIEDKSSYEYFVGGAWTTNMPAMGDDAATIENASAGGQGTYYYSEHWQSYVWIGQAAYSVNADFFITTAPAPEGPWIEPMHFYKGVDGNGSLPAYSIQANPGLTDPAVNEIYLTYTKVDELYTTPLIRVEWE